MSDVYVTMLGMVVVVHGAVGPGDGTVGMYGTGFAVAKVASDNALAKIL